MPSLQSEAQAAIGGMAYRASSERSVSRLRLVSLSSHIVSPISRSSSAGLGKGVIFLVLNFLRRHVLRRLVFPRSIAFFFLSCQLHVVHDISIGEMQS